MSAGDRQATRVTVLDEPFAIQSDAEPAYTRRVAAHVDATLRELRGAAPTLDPFPIAVLGAMEITDTLFQSRETLEAIMGGAVERVDALTETIDRALEDRTEED